MWLYHLNSDGYIAVWCSNHLLVVFNPRSTYVSMYCILLCCTYIHRVDSMLFTCLLWVAMLALPNTLLLRWEFTCLISLMKRIQHSTGLPLMDTCQWWNTSSKVLDLMWKTKTRSVCKHSSLKWPFWYLSCMGICILWNAIRCHICTAVLILFINGSSQG